MRIPGLKTTTLPPCQFTAPSLPRAQTQQSERLRKKFHLPPRPALSDCFPEVSLPPLFPGDRQGTMTRPVPGKRGTGIPLAHPSFCPVLTEGTIGNLAQSSLPGNPIWIGTRSGSVGGQCCSWPQPHLPSRHHRGCGARSGAERGQQARALG